MNVQHHPIFARLVPANAWRPACVGSPGFGDDSVRQYFHSLRFVQCYEQWNWEVPQQVQNWGFSPEDNQLLHEHLQWRQAKVAGERQAKVAVEKPPQKEFAGAATENLDQFPAFLVLDTEEKEASPPSVLSRQSFAFSGCGSKPLEEIDRFDLEIPSGKTDNREAVVMIITDRIANELVHHLKLLGKLQQGAEKVTRVEEIVPIVRATFVPEVLWPAADLSRDEERAIANVHLALDFAPAIWGALDNNGRFKRSIQLPGPCPGLRRNTLVVLFLGPQLSS